MPTTVARAEFKGSSTLRPANVAWLHVPKAGTSFANVLVTWGCPNLPDNSVVNNAYSNANGQFVPGFMHAHREQCQSGMTLCGSGHVPMVAGGCNDWRTHRGNFVALFRQPEQRVLSGFYHNRHDVSDKTLDLPSYARRIAGCSVRMINGLHCGDPAPITGQMQATAMSRLEEGFAFVGLTDDWARSVCLFHLMHGGPCHKREFLDVRPGAKHDDNYDTSGLQGWTDPHDGPLYARAAELFATNVQKYHATDEACQRLCPQSNGAFTSESVEVPEQPLARGTQLTAGDSATALEPLGVFASAFDQAMATADESA